MKGFIYSIRKIITNDDFLVDHRKPNKNDYKISLIYYTTYVIIFSAVLIVTIIYNKSEKITIFKTTYQYVKECLIVKNLDMLVSKIQNITIDEAIISFNNTIQYTLVSGEQCDNIVIMNSTSLLSDIHNHDFDILSYENTLYIQWYKDELRSNSTFIKSDMNMIYWIRIKWSCVRGETFYENNNPKLTCFCEDYIPGGYFM